ncbi:hypothetical protein, unlikely [Trypanosoma brucei brucei TREU927]|uniref:Uncharacterized protein n=1 Tax=Trypanosoma brucei brucei (strain 927/4 GUTat10.1) TaxID=185431 RepID=Q38E11_TRYB2|nr:hypothetical protein, unlikely [Trypanosoma brucei brucei TREU927]EAN76959.1 hypothetical protein, unlikely [Trypanosoma brucei brucei TREU927]
MLTATFPKAYRGLHCFRVFSIFKGVHFQSLVRHATEEGPLHQHETLPLKQFLPSTEHTTTLLCPPPTHLNMLQQAPLSRVSPLLGSTQKVFPFIWSGIMEPSALSLVFSAHYWHETGLFHYVFPIC